MAEASTPIPHAETAAAFFATLQRVGEKNSQRDALRGGRQYPVNLAIVGTVRKRRVRIQLDAFLNVERDHKQASSTKPDEKILLTWLLARFCPDEKKQKATLKELEKTFKPRSPRSKLPRLLPESLVSAELLDAVKALTKRLHQTEKKKVRGPVRCEHTLGEAK